MAWQLNRAWPRFTELDHHVTGVRVEWHHSLFLGLQRPSSPLALALTQCKQVSVHPTDSFGTNRVVGRHFRMAPLRLACGVSNVLRQLLLYAKSAQLV